MSSKPQSSLFASFQTKMGSFKEAVKTKFKKSAAPSLLQDGAGQIASKMPTAQQKNPQSEEEHAKEMAILLGLSTYDDLSSFQIDRTLTKKVPYSFVKRHFVLPVAE